MSARLDQIRETVTRTRTEQGLPARIEDPAVIARAVAALTARPPQQGEAA